MPAQRRALVWLVNVLALAVGVYVLTGALIGLARTDLTLTHGASVPASCAYPPHGSNR